MALKKPLTISGMVLQERLRNQFSWQKKTDKFVVKSKNLELARNSEGPRFSALGAKNLHLISIEKNSPKTCHLILVASISHDKYAKKSLESFENHEHCRCLVVGRRESPG